MKIIHQLVHTLSYGDAISGEVLAMQRALLKMGFQSEIFAIHVHPNYKGLARKYTELDATFTGGLILHYSLGSPLNELYSSCSNARKFLVYHNLTPVRWFKGFNTRLVGDLEKGREELPELCNRSDILIADSNYNAQELRQLGFEAMVLGLPIDMQRWDIPTNSGIANVIKNDGSIHLLHVGRLVPNKCIEDIVKIFYFLHNHIEAKSKLWLIGTDVDSEIYSFSVKRLARKLQLEHSIQFIGPRDDGELKAFYENASCYICMSEHEGFCLPVVEAMHFGLPVISFDSTALGETIADGGVLVKQKRHAELAELIFKLATEPTLRNKMVDAGKKRLSAFSFEKFEARLAEIIKQASAPQLQRASL